MENTKLDSPQWSIELPEVADTEALGVRLGKHAQAGDLIVLSGPLGAGKTALTRGIAAGLGVIGQVSSPTFLIARKHAAGARGVPLVHVDAYRLSGPDDLADLELETELLSSVVVMEWGADFARYLTDSYFLVNLVRQPDDMRIATVRGTSRLLSAARS